MEIEVGEYVRSNDGYIAKIIGIKKGKRDCDTYYCTDKVMANGFYEHIKKHSKNIIDLIEEGDYVNGNEITEISQDPFVKGQINLWTDIELRDVYGDYERLKYICDDIKTIVTKEQFSQMEYKLEE